MKGLLKIPSIKNRQKVYAKLQSNSSIELQGLLEYVMWSRFDARLCELITTYLAKHWHNINGLELNRLLLAKAWPAALGPILEQVGLLQDKKSAQLFANWQSLALTNVKPVGFECYWIGIYSPGGKELLKQAEENLPPFEKWGYFSNALTISKFSGLEKTMMSKSLRQKKMAELLNTKSEISVEDYLEFINYKISRRMAQMDLQGHPKLKSRGYTRNKKYSLKTSKNSDSY